MSQSESPIEQARPPLDPARIEQCRQLLEDLLRLHRETDPAVSGSEKDKKEKALQALNKVGLLAGILTEWAENQLFGIYYHVAKSEAQWIDETACNRHENETMWYGNNLPDDVFSTEDHLACERAAIAAILHNTFGIYGRMGWRMSMSQSLYALNEGQVDWLFRPINTKQQGNAYDLQAIKWAAVKHVSRLVGEGWKKTAAQQKVAEACGVTFEAVKKWEKTLTKERDRSGKSRMLIQVGSAFIHALKENHQDLNEQELYQQAVKEIMMAKNTPDELKPDYSKEESWQSAMHGIVARQQLLDEYPIDKLKDMLIEAEGKKA